MITIFTRHNVKVSAGLKNEKSDSVQNFQRRVVAIVAVVCKCGHKHVFYLIYSYQTYEFVYNVCVCSHIHIYIICSTAIFFVLSLISKNYLSEQTASGNSDTTTTTPPNIVFFLVDDLGLVSIRLSDTHTYIHTNTYI